MRNNEKGVGAIEILLIIIVIGLMIAVGWLFFDRQQSKTADTTSEQNNSQTNESQSAETADKPDETTGWFTYASPANTYNAKIPDGWNLDDISAAGTDGLWAWSSASIQHTPGKKATVTKVEGGRDGASIAFALVYNYKDRNNFSLEGSVQKIYKTDSGYAVSKYHFVEPGREGMHPPKGTITYSYDITHQAKRVAITHTILPGETDQSALIEKMINTLKIK